MNEEHPLNRLFGEAKSHAPHGEPSDFGFETRLRAALPEMTPSLADWIATFSWRFSAATLPLLVAMTVFLAMEQPGWVPEGVSGFVANWSSYLPIDL
ncbi:MAG: hypothetical protein P1U85_12990 [Verrucomicrobiales bacterium]|nr:hypothetical protein [Verrucomicrobiales bacterium]